jgi:probable DNA repair protein
VDAWLRRLWENQAEASTTHLISRAQSQCLWEQIVLARAEPGGLIATAQAARWAAQAWRDLQHFHIDPTALNGPTDTRTFLGWVAEYRSQMAQHGWIDPDQALVCLARQKPPPGTMAPVAWMGGIAPSPAETELPMALQANGWPIRLAPVPNQPGQASRVMLADEAAELAAAVAWARRQIAGGLDRLALVVPDLTRRREEVRAALGHRLDAPGGPPDHQFGPGEPAIDMPALGAALTALSLGAGSRDFGTVSRFLRSPFIGACNGDELAAAHLETQLRRAPAHQWDLFSALGERSFKGAVVNQCPTLGAALLRAASVLGDGGKRRTVSEWTEVWQRYLEALAWPAGLPAAGYADVMRLWQDLLAELAGLSPMLPPLEHHAALGYLIQVAGRVRQPGQAQGAPIEILGSLMDLGPDHQAVWLMGLDRDQWPPRPQPNPFLPIPLQRAHGMPQADAAAARITAEAAWQYARCAARTLVVSWPAARHEEATQPSWMLQSLALYEAPSAQPTAAQETRLETIPDPVPPLRAKRIPGGTRGLSLQSSCPLRAFLETRLGARELDTPSRGIAPWRRGLLAHRALEFLYGGLGGSAGFQGAQELAEQIDAAVQRAATDQLADVRGLQRRLLDLEQARLSGRIQDLLELEQRRPPFVVEGLELRRSVSLAGLTVEARLDRLDRDEQGHLIVIDYKTGEVKTNGWIVERPVDVQVPLYVLAVGGAAGAAVIIDLKSEPPRYRGLWHPDIDLPGRSGLKDQTLAELSEQWRTELTQLMQEMAAGDGRIFPDRAAAAQGAFAPATRIYERLAQ